MVWRVKCASRIQRAWRGHRSLLEIWSSQLSQPDGLSEAPVLRRKFCSRALRVAGDRLEKACDEREDALDRFLQSLDQDVARCSEQLREGLLGFEQLHGGAAISQSGPGSATSDDVAGMEVTGIRTEPSVAISRSNTVAHTQHSQAASDKGSSSTTPEAWAKAWEMAMSRGEEIDCPICFQACPLRGRCANRVELLSCSHVFHRCCIMSFESFHVFEVHVCPVCRQSYERRPISNANVEAAPRVNPANQLSAPGDASRRSSGLIPGRGSELAQRGRPPLLRSYSGRRT